MGDGRVLHENLAPSVQCFCKSKTSKKLDIQSLHFTPIKRLIYYFTP